MGRYLPSSRLPTAKTTAHRRVVREPNNRTVWTSCLCKYRPFVTLLIEAWPEYIDVIQRNPPGAHFGSISSHKSSEISQLFQGEDSNHQMKTPVIVYAVRNDFRFCSVLISELLLGDRDYQKTRSRRLPCWEGSLSGRLQGGTLRRRSDDIDATVLNGGALAIQLKVPLIHCCCICAAVVGWVELYSLNVIQSSELHAPI